MFGSSNPFGQSSGSSPFGSHTQSVFGQTNSNPFTTSTPFGPQTGSSMFGSNSNAVFGQTNSTSSNPYGTSTPFGAQTGISMFGGTSTGVFGARQASSPFGASSQPFGSSTPAFGAPSASAFGTSASPFGGTSAFGQKSFGTSMPQSFPFGNTTQQSQPAFGNGTFGASNTPTFGTTSTPAFGSTPGFGTSSTPAFGFTKSPAFGASSTPSHGASNSPAFGASPTPAFGSSGTAFGNNAFGFGGTPGFGASSTPAFGPSSTPSFSFSSSPAFGQSTSAFGQSTSAFGQPAQSPFGSQGLQASIPPFGGQQGGSRVMSYAPIAETDTGGGNLCSVSAMPVYKDKSHEELRWVDYQQGDKGGQRLGGSVFGVSNSQSSLFPTPPVFSQTSANPPNPFSSSTATNPFAQKTQTTTPSPFGQTTAPSMFGSTSSTTTSVFGSSSSSAPTPSQSLFGSSTTHGFTSSPSTFSSAPAHASTPAFSFNNSQSSALFNSNPSNGQTGSAFGQFGQTSSAFGQFGQTSSALGQVGQTSSAFGQFGQTSSALGQVGQTSSAFGQFGQTSCALGQVGQTSSAFGQFGQNTNTAYNLSTSSTGSGNLFSSTSSLTTNSSPFGQTTPAGLTPNQPAQASGTFGSNGFGQTQIGTSGTFGLNGFGQTQIANTSGYTAGMGSLTQGNFGKVPGSTDSTAIQTIPVTNPFGTLPALPQISVSQGGNSPSIQYGISSLPVVDTPAPVRVSPLLTSRHLLQRRVRPPVRRSRPGDDGPKIPFFSNEENFSTPKADALFIPRENPRALFISPVIREKSALPKNGPTPLQENGKRSNGVTNGVSHENKNDGEIRETLPAKTNQQPNRTHANHGGDKNSSPSGADIDSLMPKLHHSEYFTEPRIQELAAKERVDPGHCRRVRDFVVGRNGYGSIKFLGETDVRNLDLEMLVQFNNREVIVYMDESKKPPVGQGLNKPAEVTLLNIKCMDKKSGKQVKEGSRVDKYKEMLKRKAEEQGTEFMFYDAVKGEWKFKVEHF